MKSAAAWLKVHELNTSSSDSSSSLEFLELRFIVKMTRLKLFCRTKNGRRGENGRKCEMGIQIIGRGRC